MHEDGSCNLCPTGSGPDKYNAYPAHFFSELLGIVGFKLLIGWRYRRKLWVLWNGSKVAI
jgi:hypothetical protein